MSGTESDDDDLAEAAERLEVALERIAQAAQQGMIGLPAGLETESSAQRLKVSPEVHEIAARLDQLIAELRAALARAG